MAKNLFTRHLVLVCCCACVVCVGVLAPAAGAATGGAVYSNEVVPGPITETSRSGGAGAGDKRLPSAKERKQERERKARAEARRTPVITGAELSPTTLLDEGRPLKLRYRVKASAKRVRVKLVIRSRGNKFIRTLDLGAHRTGVLQSTELTQAELGVRGPGGYKLRLVVRDGKGRRAARASKVPTWIAFTFADHRFPVAGPFSFGGDGSRFGSGREDHIHQGQDLSAPSGTPVVLPYAGQVSWVKYQAGGAGYYVVVRGNDKRDYVFMHLLKDSINVKEGDVIPTGKLIGRVGSTGASSGPHLHFEIWVGGPWQLGGSPIDPLPLLKKWYASAPGGAIEQG